MEACAVGRLGWAWWAWEAESDGVYATQEQSMENRSSGNICRTGSGCIEVAPGRK